MTLTYRQRRALQAFRAFAREFQLEQAVISARKSASSITTRSAARVGGPYLFRHTARPGIDSGQPFSSPAACNSAAGRVARRPSMTALTDSIRGRGHWRIVVRPGAHVPDRVPYSNLRQTIERAAIQE
jgi:hypothetical protein